jgi:hypothetical protein
MNPNSQLLLGIVLIGLGILIAVFAYIVLTGRRQDREIPSEDEDAEEPLAQSPETEQGYPDVDIPTAEPEMSGEGESIADEEIMEPAPEASVAPEHEGEFELENVQEDSPPAEVPSQVSPELSSRTEIAMLMRDEGTGALIVRVGEREYASASELMESEDWARIEFASKDLARWIARVTSPETPSGPAVEERPTKPKSMIEQINAILQRKIADTPGDQKAVRLIEGPGGSVRVLLGLHSYNLDEVPDPEARELIRQAVATWEDLQ